MSDFRQDLDPCSSFQARQSLHGTLLSSVPCFVEGSDSAVLNICWGLGGLGGQRADTADSRETEKVTENLKNRVHPEI